ncbi:MAG: cation diffusion facilitator family transporter [Myxococcales bacterium]|nr:cation diffusion facilitator family transporter [Myxococcales bacterium]MDH3483680.1 cation diffusion facilitator family transporter [Myxococcales bacterium]
MGQDHSHAGSAAKAAGNRKRLAFALALTAVYMVAEIVGGYLSNSLALLADAGHMFSDVAALGLSLAALGWAQRPATTARTFGFHRAEILAAFINGAALLAVAILIAIEAWERLSKPEEINATLMVGIATGGLAINLINLKILSGGKNESLNVRGAWLHVMADTLGSVGAIIAGLSILIFGWVWADPIASLLITTLVVYSAWGLLRETLDVLMQSVPRHIALEDVIGALEEQPGVVDVHDLHIWSLTSGRHVATTHLVVTGTVDPQAVISAARRLLSERFDIDHTTIQVESSGSRISCNPCDPPARAAS